MIVFLILYFTKGLILFVTKGLKYILMNNCLAGSTDLSKLGLDIKKSNYFALITDLENNLYSF
jgi:hypothetical protein